MNKIIMVGGGKGGVGKTTVAIGLVDSLLTNGKQVMVVETDESNPDAHFALESIVQSEICNLEDIEGWVKLSEIVEQNKDKYIVINTAAGVVKHIKAHGKLLSDTAKELKRDLIMLWPINRQRDCLELLNKFADTDSAVDYKATYVVKNTYFGESKKFSRFDNSKVKARTTGTIDMPELYDMLTDKIVDNRWALSNTQGLSIAERSVLARYREAVDKALGVVYG